MNVDKDWPIHKTDVQYSTYTLSYQYTECYNNK